MAHLNGREIVHQLSTHQQHGDSWQPATVHIRSHHARVCTHTASSQAYEHVLGTQPDLHILLPSPGQKTIITHLYAHWSSFVRVVIDRCATCVILARASPRNPKVPMDLRSSNDSSFDVVKRSQTMSRLAFCIGDGRPRWVRGGVGCMYSMEVVSKQ